MHDSRFSSAFARSRRRDVLVYVATTPHNGPAGTDRHVADELSRRGPVVYVDPPTSIVNRIRTRRSTATAPPERGVRLVHDSLAVVSPRVPPAVSWRPVHHLEAPLVARAIRHALMRLLPHEAPSAPVRGIVSAHVGVPWSTVPSLRRVYFVTDDHVAGAELLGVPVARLARQEAAMLGSADAVAATSPVLVDRLTATGWSAHLVPNGCAPEAYAGVDDAPLPADVVLPSPVAGFVGLVNDRIDLALLEAVADTGTSLLLVGPRAGGHRSPRFEALVARNGVCWVGARPFEQLPGYLRLIDVGLTPYADTAFNRASFPLKTLEYLAAGRPVVSTPLPATRWLDTDLIETAAGPADFAARVVALSTSGRTEEQVRARRAFASRHSWEARAEALEALVSRAAAVGRSR